MTWTPDGASILYGAEPGDVVMRRADGAGAERFLFKYRGSEYTWPASFSPDGRLLALHRLSTTTNWDVLLAPVHRDAAGEVTIGEFVPFAASPAIEWYPEISPDGQWMAYVSTESGRNEIYVQSITPALGKWQVTWEGGNFPRWSRAANELFFQNGDAMLAAHYERLGAGLRFEKPSELFHGEFVDVSPFSAYDVMPDGQRFIMLKAQEGTDTDRAHVTLVTNWSAELSRLAGEGSR
jgi:serine/threonine-protein kinase